jgi:hypothetical protein
MSFWACLAGRKRLGRQSWAHALWALGECARSGFSPSRRQWARDLFDAALPSAEGFVLRAPGRSLLGLDAYCSTATDAFAALLRLSLADRLIFRSHR